MKHTYTKRLAELEALQVERTRARSGARQLFVQRFSRMVERMEGRAPTPEMSKMEQLACLWWEEPAAVAEQLRTRARQILERTQ